MLSWYNFPKKVLALGDGLQFNDEVGNNFYYDASSCDFIVGIISLSWKSVLNIRIFIRPMFQ